MKYTIAKRITNLCVLPGFFLFFSQNTYSLPSILEPSAQLKMELLLGLTPSTIDFLHNYPPELQKVILETLTKGLDRVDSSVIKTDEAIQRIISSLKEAVRCGADKTGEIVKTSIWEVFGLRTQKLSDLDKLLEVGKDGFNYNSRPKDIRIFYADFDLEASRVVCSATPNSSAEKEIGEMRQEAGSSYLVWSKLSRQYSCDTSQGCYSLLNEIVKAKLGQAPRQDKITINADKRYAEIADPRPEKTGWFSKNYNLEKYEESIGKLMQIKDELQIAQTARISKGEIAHESFRVELEKAKSDVAIGKTLGRSVKACNIGYSIMSKIPSLKMQLESVAAYEVLSNYEILQERGQLSEIANTALYYSQLKGGWVNNGIHCEEYPRIPRRDFCDTPAGRRVCQ